MANGNADKWKRFQYEQESVITPGKAPGGPLDNKPRIPRPVGNRPNRNGKTPMRND